MCERYKRETSFYFGFCGIKKYKNKFIKNAALFQAFKWKDEVRRRRENLNVVSVSVQFSVVCMWVVSWVGGWVAGCVCVGMRV